jgi:hypothetical protein
MAETRYTEQDQAESNTADEVIAEYEVELASLNDSEMAQVKDALSEAEFNNEIDQINVEAEISNAQFAEEDRAEAQDAQREQAQAADNGDVEDAREKAEEVQANLNEASEHGASLNEAQQENDVDVEVLTEAEFQADTAEYFEADSAESLDDGEYDADTDAAADHADDAADNAVDYTEQADQGGTYGDQSIYTDNV